ncbi:hypothetical protein D3C86_2175680 [compost metagenome]
MVGKVDHAHLTLCIREGLQPTACDAEHKAQVLTHVLMELSTRSVTVRCCL